MNKNSKIYVAGYHGLVGSAILKTLQQKGYTNIIGKTSKELDLRDPMAVRTFFEWEKPEYVFLAAAKVGGIVANSTYRAEFIYDNLMIQNNVIHEAYRNRVKKLMFLGSTCIYPREAPQPMKEEYLLTSPLEYTNEPYAIAKIAGIKMCESYNLQYGTNFISVMPTNLYGPNDNFNLETSHVLPALIRKIHLGKCLEESNWDAIRNDLNKRPIENVNGQNTNDEILQILKKYGITLSSPHPLALSPSRPFVPSSPRPFALSPPRPFALSPPRPLVSVEIWGSGKPMREFLWSEEMADACVFIMENINFEDLIPDTSLRGGGTTTKQSHQQEIAALPPVVRNDGKTVEIRNTHINIGTGKEISIKSLAELIKKTVGFQGELVFNTSKPDGTMRKLTNVTKLHNLGWHHQIEIEEGVERMYRWYGR